MKIKYNGVYKEKKNELGVSELIVDDGSRCLFLSFDSYNDEGLYYLIHLFYYEKCLWELAVKKDDDQL